MKNLKNALVSVVIPTYNEEKDIRDCLDSLLKQSYKNIEIIIVDDGSTDKTREIVTTYSKNKVKLIEGMHKGPGFSRNLGAKQAKGVILVFVDADMFFDRDYIKNLTLPILHGKSIGTEERYQKASNLDKVWSRCWGSYVTGDRKNKDMKGIVFRAILKSKFFEMGGFDPKLGYADDLTFYFKHHVIPDLAENAICYHKNPSTPKEIYKQSVWIGKSRFLYYSLLGKRMLFPFIALLGVIALIPLSFYVFIKRILTRRFVPANIGEIFVLLAFSFIRVYGTFVGILKRNLRPIVYR